MFRSAPSRPETPDCEDFGTYVKGQTLVVFYSLSYLTVLPSLLPRSRHVVIGEYHGLDLGHSDGALSSVYGSMSFLNGCVTVAFRVFSQYLVHLCVSEAAPFFWPVPGGHGADTDLEKLGRSQTKESY